MKLKLHKSGPVPLWIKLPYTILALVVLPVYWVKYGALNFLWFSDIAFFAMAPALWMRNRFIPSMMAIGVMPLEALWLLSFVTHGAFIGMADYMFDDTLPLWLRVLSLFHFPMPAAIFYMVWKEGYDKRALFPQIFFALGVLLASHLYTERSENVNIIYPPKGVADFVPEHIYIWLMPLTLVTCSIIPMHFLLKRFFGHAKPA